MTEDVQFDEPAAALLAAAHRAVPGWLRRVTLAAAPAPAPLGDFEADVDRMVATAAPDLLDRLATLLATDVDEQRTNPLSVFRAGVGAPTALLRSYGVPHPPGDDFDSVHFPDDVYRLGPATWSDIDPTLREPGVTWGAWKAMTVLRRRRDEGLR